MGVPVSMIENKVYLPTDPEWKTDADVGIIAGAAFGPERFCLAASLSGANYFEFDNYCRFFRYVDGQWVMSDVGDRIQTLLPYQHTEWRNPGLIAMSWQGQFVFLGDTVWQENIPTAGIDANGAKGYLEFLVKEAGHLWAGGANGQIYRRAPNGTWPATDRGSFRSFDPSQINEYALHTLRSIGNSVFAAGLLRSDEGIVLRLSANETWEPIKFNRDLAWVHDLFDENGRRTLIGASLEVYVFEEGHKIRPLVAGPNIRKNPDFDSFVRYRDTVFLVDGFNLLHLDGDKIRRFDSYDSSRNWAQILQVFDKYLWVFGNRGAARFDGQDWKYFFPPSFT
jgi:hypothetical protein